MTITYVVLNMLNEQVRYDITLCPICRWQKTSVRLCREHASAV